MITSLCCNSIAGHQIATNFCTCHDSTAVVPCTKFCSDYGIRVEVRVKRNFHRIWITMEKPFVKRGPGSWNLQVHEFSCCGTCHPGRSYLVHCPGALSLTHLPLDKMAAISQTIFSDAFSWMKKFIFCLKFHWSLFLKVQLTITQN